MQKPLWQVGLVVRSCSDSPDNTTPWNWAFVGLSEEQAYRFVHLAAEIRGEQLAEMIDRIEQEPK